MQLSIADSVSLAHVLRHALAHMPARKSPEISLAPSALALHAVGSALEGSPISLAAQNCFWEPKGSYTGETSIVQLNELACKFVITGHSERRILFGETIEDTHRKVVSVLNAGMRPILCVGEDNEEHKQGQTLLVVQTMLQQALGDLSPDLLRHVVVAYEPVWAIGTGIPALPEQIQQIHFEIRKFLSHLAGTVAQSMRIVYGGSVNAAQMTALCAFPDVDGALVGKASLVAESFVDIVRSYEGVSWVS